MMNLNFTLVGQMVTFALFVFFTMHYVWPHIIKVLEERRKTIADGLAAAEKGQRDLELASHKTNEMLAEAKSKAAHIIEEAGQRSNKIIEEAKVAAREEGKRLLEVAQGEIEQEFHAARKKLMQQVTTIAVAGAEKIIREKINDTIDSRLLDELIKEVGDGT